MSTEQKVRNRWIVVIGAILIQLALGTIYSWGTITIFVSPYLNELREVTVYIFGVGLLSFAVTMIFAGKLQQKYGPKKIAILGGILIGIGVIIITKVKSNEISIENDSSFKNQNTYYHSKLKDKVILKTLKGTLWAVFAAISWAIGIALSDFSISQVNLVLDLGILSTMIAMMVRFLFAATVLSTIAVFEGRKTPIPKSRNTWKILIISAILSYSIGSLFFGEAVHTAGASFMSLICTALPLFTIPFSYIINKEKISKKAFIGVIITLLGVILILF